MPKPTDDNSNLQAAMNHVCSSVVAERFRPVGGSLRQASQNLGMIKISLFHLVFAVSAETNPAGLTSDGIDRFCQRWIVGPEVRHATIQNIGRNDR